VRVLDGGEVRALDAGGVAARVAAAARVVFDVGTGDGRFAWRLARRHPDWLVVGIDPARDRMVDTARRATRRPQRGGTPNLLLVWAAIEDDDLAALGHHGDEVLVLAPWGRLLAGVVRPDPDVLRGLRRVARPGASLTVTWGARLWEPPVPEAVRHLPPPPVGDGVDLPGGFTDAYRRAGWAVDAVRSVGPDELGGLDTPWSRRLADRPDERFLVLQAGAVTAG
jgi:16S rRNA (adenine(1408)-N(1))-methyltransferase